MLAKLSKQLFEDINKALSNHSGATTESAREILPHKELQALLESALRRLNLVTREEFDAQVSVLLRTREKLESLEKELALLQQSIEEPTEQHCPDEKPQAH